jgi:transposase
VEALNDGMSIRKAVEELRLSKSKIERLKKEAFKRGMLDD